MTSALTRVKGLVEEIEMSAMLCASPEDSPTAGLAAGPWGLRSNGLA